MATIEANTFLTQVEIVKRMDPEGDLMPIVEQLDREDEMLQDIPWMPTNDTTSHVSNVRNFMPGGARRRYNRGSTAAASATDPRRNVTTTLERFSDIDELIGEDSGDLGTLRAQEGAAFFEQFMQDVGDDIMYGDETTDVDNMTGFMPRMSTVDNTRVLNNGGSGSDLMSILLVQWGMGQVTGLYPKNTTAGLYRRDWGERFETDSDGRRLVVWREQFRWRYGLAVEDDRCIARVANIEKTGANTFNFEPVIDASTQMKRRGKNAIAYVPATLWAQIQKEAINKSNNNLTMSNVFGDGEIPTINGIPVRFTEALSESESAIS
jgi:hypothetical protein